VKKKELDILSTFYREIKLKMLINVDKNVDKTTSPRSLGKKRGAVSEFVAAGV
jgi:hypothetical protein